MPGDVVVYDNKVTRRMIAEVASNEPAFKAAAVKVAAEVAAAVAKHTRTGRLAASIKASKGRTDWHIESTSLHYNWNTEFGHFQGRAGKGTRKWVKGINAFRSVVAKHGGF